MQLINQTRNTVLATSCIVAKNPISRMRGLLGRKDLLDGEALVLEPGNSIHTFFMNFSIDVLFVDKKNKIIKVIENLKPWRLTYIYWRSYLVIELPPKTIKSSQTVPGDIVTMSSL